MNISILDKIALSHSKRIFLLLFAFIIPLISFATHNRAGEIIYKRIEGLKYEIKIITYTEIGNDNADRPELGIDYGDNSGIDSIKRSNIVKPFIKNNIQKNEYKTTHTYPGHGTYTLKMEDPNRNANVVNIPNSVDQVFFIQSTLNTNIEASVNNSPLLLNPPIAFACLRSPFYYSPGAFDPDGDSLVYELVECKGNGGQIIPGYSYPTASNVFEIDSFSGIVTWDEPTKVGEYNIAIEITEYRNVIDPFTGQKNTYMVGKVLRDMQITVIGDCDNEPPILVNVRDYCVEARKNLSFTIAATDQGDQGSTGGTLVTLEAFGAPMVIEPTAKWAVTGRDSVFGMFDWDTECNHVQRRPYTMTFKATDNGQPELSNYQTSEILVVAPSVKNVEAKELTSFIDLSWEKEVCTEAIGYRIYRRLGRTGFVPDSCETGVPDYLGYTLIHENRDINTTEFQDDNEGKGLIPGEVYCYLIIAYFADGAESYASQEVCTQLKKDIPIITNVSVTRTDKVEGTMYIAWSPPSDHNDTLYPGPYKYKLMRTENRNPDNFELVAELAGNSTNIWPDTTYNDAGLNTDEVEYTYRIEMLDLSASEERSMGFSAFSTSIYLTTDSKDNKLILKWDELVAWRNYEYIIYRKNASGTFDSIGFSKTNQFIDSNLTNGNTYCYYITSKGEYSLKSIAKPLFNNSQEHCGVPIDLQPPCPPELKAYVEPCDVVREKLALDSNLCGNSGDNPDRIDQVYLYWTNPNVTCDSTDDVVGYELFYSPIKKGTYEPVENERFPEYQTEYDHQLNNTRAGCYYIQAIDSFDNRSPVIDTVCTENCNTYQLPNVFTPNGDGINDLFRPFPYCFIDKVEMRIVNRWGKLVYRTTDPDILWDGIDMVEKTLVNDGVYYYTCVVDQISVEGIKKIELKGMVHLLGGKEIQQR